MCSLRCLFNCIHRFVESIIWFLCSLGIFSTSEKTKFFITKLNIYGCTSRLSLVKILVDLCQYRAAWYKVNSIIRSQIFWCYLSSFFMYYTCLKPDVIRGQILRKMCTHLIFGFPLCHNHNNRSSSDPFSIYDGTAILYSVQIFLLAYLISFWCRTSFKNSLI